MFTIKVKYEDFNGMEREETLYFNLNKTELLDLEVAFPGGLEAYGKHLTESPDRKQFVDFIHDLLRRTYGVKDSSGKRFIKSGGVFEEFKESPAYDEVFLKLLTDDDFAYNFLTNAIPKGEGNVPTKEEIQAKINEDIKSNDIPTLSLIDGGKETENRI